MEKYEVEFCLKSDLGGTWFKIELSSFSYTGVRQAAERLANVLDAEVMYIDGRAV